MKILFNLIIIFVISIQSAFSQTISERTAAILAVEKTLYDEFYLEIKCYVKTDIVFNELDESFEIKNELFLGKDQNINTKRSFNLDDIDLNSMTYDITSNGDGLYFVTVNINAKDKLIEVYTVDTNRKKFPVPVSSTEYQDILVFSPTGKALPMKLALRFVDNIKIMLGAPTYRREQLFK